MKKLTRSNIDDMAELLPALDEDEQRGVLGGSGSYVTGSVTEGGYSWEQMDSMVSSGSWTGGYVDGLGYVGPVTNVTGYYSERTDSYDNLMLTWEDMADIGLGADVLNELTHGKITGLSGASEALGYIDLAHQAINITVDGEVTSYEFNRFGVNVEICAGGIWGAATELTWGVLDNMMEDLQEQGKSFLIKMGSTMGKDGNYSFFKFGFGL